MSSQSHKKNIAKQHTYKSNKYAHFETDITQYNTKVIAFGVGSRGGLTTENTKRLGDTHTHFIKKDIKNPAYGRHRISRPMRIVAPIQ